MNICRLVWDYPRPDSISYGLGPNFYHVSNEQIKQGFDVHVVASKRDNTPEYEEIDGVHVHRVDFPYNLRAIQKIKSLHSAQKFDVIHAHGTCGISYPLFKSSIRRPLAVHVHGTTLGMMQHNFSPSPTMSMRDFSRSKLREHISAVRQKYFWKRANGLIAVSDAQTAEIHDLYNIDKARIHIAYNGVDPAVFARNDGSDELKSKLGLEGKQVIIFVGHFGFRKGILYLYKAMPEVLKAVPDAALLCVGGTPKWLGTDVYWRVLQEHVDKYDLKGKITLLGQVPHHLLPQYYSMADVFAFPSLYEAFGKVIIEAMACETPVIATNVGGIPEIINHGSEGFLIEPKDVKGLAQHLIQILQDRKLAVNMGRQGRLRVEKQFTWAHTASAISQIYDSMVNEGDLES